MYCYCVFLNQTTANRVKKMVNKDLYYVALTQAPKAIAKSCSYALKFDEAKLSQVKNVIKSNGFSIQGIYRETVSDNGEKEYQKIN